MTYKCFLLFLTLVSLSWAEDAFSLNEIALKIDMPIPTAKETSPISAQNMLLTGHFRQNTYAESQGFSSKAYWHKLTFPKTDSEQASSPLYLGLNYYVIEHLDFYLFHGDQLKSHWTKGALDNWQRDNQDYKGIWIPFTLSSQQTTTLLVRKQGNSPLLTPFTLSDQKAVDRRKDRQLIFWSFIISSLSILLAHNVFVFILLRQPGFIYYLGINIVIFIALSAITGFNRWIFPEAMSQWIISNLFMIFGIGAWMLFRFSLLFLKDVQVPSPNAFIRKYGDGIFIVFLVSTLLLSVKTSALLFAMLEVFMFIICGYWGIKAYAKGFIAVRFYLFSWFFLISGSILNTFIFWKILPINLLTESILPVCSMLQLLGFSFAFADKAKHIERNRQLQALTDSPTGLPNRTYYFDRLPRLLAENYPASAQLALIMIDISNYRVLSQAFGPAKADSAMSETIQNIHKQVLKMTGMLSFPLPNKSQQKLIRIMPTNIVLISTTPDHLDEQIRQLQVMLDSPNFVSNTHFRHQYKIGSALYPSQGSNLDKLYQNALIANNAVNYSSSNWLPFTDDLKSNHAHQLNVIMRLADDIKNEKLHFTIQPQVNLMDNTIAGGEVLIRWHNEQLGHISPAEFIPLAEQAGLIYKLTSMLFKKVFQWVSQNPKAIANQCLSINISALDLLQTDFAISVVDLLTKHHLPANKFTIEITETSIFQNSKTVLDNVKHLHHAGFRLAIDDFGVGYSSMQNLVALETNELKIDQFFVINLLTDPQSQTLCRCMINLSKSLNIISVAEGIESEEILQMLKTWHCQVGQGYHLYRPMPPPQYLKLLAEKDPPLSGTTNRA